MSEKERPDKPELLSVQQYADLRGTTRQTVYKRLFTPETPNGDIIPDVENGKWKIDPTKNTHVVFEKPTRRTKVPLSK